MVHFPYKERYAWEDFLLMMRLLRSPDGCPWDRVQTHRSIRRNFLEETYEALDALDRDDAADLCEELGDVLMQVAFHAQIEAERGRFTMEDVVHGVTEKLRRRHPHVFEDAAADSADAALNQWEQRKRTEKGHAGAADAVDAVPRTLPALWRAEKMISRSAKAGFQWDSPLHAQEKAEEEVRELREAVETGRAVDRPHGVREEVGDALFCIVKVAQMYGVDPEDALHRSCDKFARRFRGVEEGADRPLTEYREAELIALWRAAKAAEKEPRDGGTV